MGQTFAKQKSSAGLIILRNFLFFTQPNLVYTRLNMSDVFTPPKAKLFDMMYSVSNSRPEPIM